MSEKIYSVNELNLKIKNFIDNEINFYDLFVKGEISNIKYYKSGHLYFTLKDENSSINCTAFNYRYKKISTDLKNGDLVKIFGRLNFYEKTGQIQLLVSFIEKQEKLGALFEKLEELKKRYREKGWFEIDRKKPLPFLPLNIGVVTSEHGAAIHDIINTTKKRFNNANIYLYPAKVQGEGADIEIAKGINALSELDFIDVIIAGRGGGSIEDLWAFNEEITAKAFYYCKKPIVSAVGHESDLLLTDLIADKRASTPTQAIEIILPEKKYFYEILNNKYYTLNKIINNKILSKKEKLINYKNNYTLNNFNKLIQLKNDILNNRYNKLNTLIENKIKIEKKTLLNKIDVLKKVNPLSILEKGYSIVYKGENIIKSMKNLKNDDIINIRVYDGEFKAKIFDIKRSDDE
ncbi:MAG: exodeoxyribonuclease large subunit [Fusobacteriaceae bacterium]|jgi:exodeoxyribonuclease VII large subunit|nr:xseA [Fusobacteriales bacterium]MDN5303264.1 exodeoxyribonuclease large subunit [Fusobacteriaceae bacterium]